jgi:1-deoxy-D-xylulose 5-phosphate reductoisomerase
LPFPAIPATIEEVMADHPSSAVGRLEDVLEADTWARDRTRRALARHGRARV